jgi:hypothetical protein
MQQIILLEHEKKGRFSEGLASPRLFRQPLLHTVDTSPRHSEQIFGREQPRRFLIPPGGRFIGLVEG